MRTVTNAKKPGGFTLIELSIVILIIGLLMAFVLAASAASLESARVRATQALITKLSVGLEERLEALLSTQVPVNGAHQFLAAIPTTNLGLTPAQNLALSWGLRSDQRAAVIARLDQIKSEFPDVFFIDPSGDKRYPIKFAGLPYNPGGNSVSPNDGHYVLPIGNSVAPPYRYQVNGATGPGDFVAGLSNPVGTGINGASYMAAASLNKIIGYTQRGCDGVDNDNDGFVDDSNEGTTNSDGSVNADAQRRITNFLANHTHKTARTEMLYALLVEGLGPLGSVFTREDFRDNEIGDTDNDGAPEFIDGWGEPLQFFRWPSWHRSDVQKGDAIYGQFEARQMNPLDQNGQLTTLGWWCDNSSPSTVSARCQLVQNLFCPLTDRSWVSGSQPQPNAWDRSGASPRRSYFTKFLILSSGPDRAPGVPLMTNASIASLATADAVSTAILGSVTNSVPGENWAMLLDPTDPMIPAWRDTANDPLPDGDVSLDDISNQELPNKAGGIQ